MIRGVALALLAGMAVFVSRAQAECGAADEVALTRAGNMAFVDVALDGRPARLVLDTGSVRTVLSPRAAAALGLAPDTWASGALRGLGGIDRHRDVAVASVTMGRTRLARALGAVRTLGVAVVPTAVAGLPVDGLLGLDLLATHGITVDLERNVLTLLPPGCLADADVLPSDPDLPLFVVAATLGGRAVRALIDTGAQATILADRAAARFGLPLSAAADTASGIGPNAVRLRLASPGALAIGRARFGDAPVFVGPLPPGGFDLVLGMDRLAHATLRFDRMTRRVTVETPDTE